MAEYAEMDMAWYETAQTAVTYYLQGKAAREGREQHPALRAVK